MPKLNQVLGNNLARIIDQKGLTQTDLAKKLGTTFKTVNSYINGKAGISGKMISQLAEILEVEETDLISIPKVSDEDYKAFFDLSSKVNKLEKENQDLLNRLNHLNECCARQAIEIAELRKNRGLDTSETSNIPASVLEKLYDPEIQEAVLSLSSLDDVQRKSSILNLRILSSSIGAHTGRGNEKKIR